MKKLTERQLARANHDIRCAAGFQKTRQFVAEFEKQIGFKSELIEDVECMGDNGEGEGEFLVGVEFAFSMRNQDRHDVR